MGRDGSNICSIHPGIAIGSPDALAGRAPSFRVDPLFTARDRFAIQLLGRLDDCLLVSGL